MSCDTPVDAAGRTLSCSMTKQVELHAGEGSVQIKMLSCPAIHDPVVSLVDLVRQGITCQRVEPVHIEGGFAGRVAIGLLLDGTWVPVFMEDRHFWMYANGDGKLLTHPLSPVTSSGPLEEYMGDTFALLDSGANIHVCPGRFNPSDNADTELTEDCQVPGPSRGPKSDCNRSARSALTWDRSIWTTPPMLPTT